MAMHAERHYVIEVPEQPVGGFQVELQGGWVDRYYEAGSNAGLLKRVV